MTHSVSGVVCDLLRARQSVTFRHIACMDFDVFDFEIRTQKILYTSNKTRFTISAAFKVDLHGPIEFFVLHLVLQLVIEIYKLYIGGNISRNVFETSRYFSNITRNIPTDARFMIPNSFRDIHNKYESLLNQFPDPHITYNNIYSHAQVDYTVRILQEITEQHESIWNNMHPRYLWTGQNILKSGGSFYDCRYTKLFQCI